MRAIQTYLPHPHHTELMRIFVNAKPEVAWNAARHFDMSSVSWVKFLFDLRTVTDLFHHSRAHFRNEEHLSIDAITENSKGFIKLHEIPGNTVVVGAIGKFWHIDIPFKEIRPETFAGFDEEGWGKVAWSITVEPYLHGCTIAFELRTGATDRESWEKLNLYYHVIGAFSRLIRHALLDKLEDQLGVMEFPDDNKKQLAGDAIIGETKYQLTDHVNIEAPVSIVWQYLMQLGCDRAGWYSIDRLDNAGKKSTNHQVTIWSDRNVGDKLSATPKGDTFFEVYEISHEKFFVIGGESTTGENIFKSTWAFVPEPLGEDATHLVVRAKMHMTPPWKEWFMGKVFYPPVHTIMESAQLKTIKRYAERDAQSRVDVNAHAGLVAF